MKYKKISRTLCCLLQIIFLASCASTSDQSDSVTPEDEFRQLMGAAAYIRVFDLFVTRVDRSCTELLGEDDTTMQGIAGGWRSRNKDYIDAGRTLMMALEFTIIKREEEMSGAEKGFAEARTEAGEFAEIIQRGSTQMAENFLSGSHAEQVESCNRFADEFSAGDYDITPESEHYLQLARIIQLTEK